MLIQESHVDIPTSTTPMRLFIFHPLLPSGKKARFPGLIVFTEIYQVTAPITRFCRQLAGHGFIVASCSSYHEFMGPEALAYDEPGKPPSLLQEEGPEGVGTTRGNELKVEKTVEGYDEDARLTIDYLCGLETCNGRIGATGTWLKPFFGGVLGLIWFKGCVLEGTLHSALHLIRGSWPPSAFSERISIRKHLEKESIPIHSNEPKKSKANSS